MSTTTTSKMVHEHHGPVTAAPDHGPGHPAVKRIIRDVPGAQVIRMLLKIGQAGKGIAYKIRNLRLPLGLQ